MSKPIKIMLSVLISLTIIGVIAIIILLYGDTAEGSPGERTLDDMVESSFVTEEITTDLSDGNYVRIQFRVVTDGEKAHEHLQKGEAFQLNNAIIKELTVLEEEDFRSGLNNVEENIKLELNQLLEEGTVTDVYTVDKVLQ
ncbi:flagellar basal body-associated protein FliL [Halalkalibacillus sediminis]|uniref:Flagellar protein FliL n=1 Tax=Halalkalibacillus sediminis TaxID=2018042 RepID=A0A2I0QWE0_9BACI|nr:flagellar basal body-associated FliL family protein [Halalkalibacillus sediminis]PKR78628.1 flagellar basal body-associated protein FliL [Halalkalibacillus sediminis]